MQLGRYKREGKTPLDSDGRFLRAPDQLRMSGRTTRRKRLTY